jgi:glycosyltransferase involved in cell wall biosynthesis
MSNRVLHVIRTAGVSGAENHLATLVEVLPAYGWTADVLLAAPEPAALEGFAERLAAPGGTVRRLRMRGDVSPRLLSALRSSLTGDHYDLLHTHLVHADWHAGLASTGIARPRLVSTKHNHDPFRARFAFRAVERAWLRRCAGSIAISASLGDFVARHHGVRPTTVLYGWPAGDPPPERSGAVRRLLAVGRLEPQKGFDVLVDAVAILRRQGVDVKLDIAGEGGERARLTAQIARAGLEAHVALLGRREDVAALMRGADAFVHPARWEGFGLVLLEAMSAGLPIVATAVGAIPEVVADGETALLAPPDSPEAFAAAVAGLVADPVLARRLGVGGYERLSTRFTPVEMARRTAAVYASALRATRA